MSARREFETVREAVDALEPFIGGRLAVSLRADHDRATWNGRVDNGNTYWDSPSGLLHSLRPLVTAYGGHVLKPVYDVSHELRRIADELPESWDVGPEEWRLRDV